MRCPVCDGQSFAYLFVVRAVPVVRCSGCGCVAQDASAPRPPEPPDFTPAADSRTERDAAARYLQALRGRGLTAGHLLIVCGAGPCVNTAAFIAEAKQQGFAFTLAGGDLARLEPGPYDAAILLHQLQTSACPAAILQQVHAALRPRAPLLLTLPNVTSWPARFFGPHWTEWRSANRWYFDPATVQLLLLRSGFGGVLVRPDRRLYTLRHIHARAATAPATALTRSISLLHTLLPAARGFRARLSTSGMIATALRQNPAPGRKCSILVAAYNEQRSFPVLMDALLKKELPCAREIIVVESNSTDGTRELAQAYQHLPDVRIVLQDRPRGKGNAIREGLRHVSGDLVLVQDADLEYDLDDYDALLAPVLSNKALLVLGTRHAGNWKMRRFAGQRSLSAALNFGHLFFTGLINLLYRQRLTDPFTMFKVFHRDCLFGLEFSCNRFDFDHELLIKFIRKGYVPLEIPVNYASRSFREGKKVRLFRDPFQWLWVDLKLRFTRLLPKDLA